LTSGKIYFHCEGDEQTLPLAKQIFGSKTFLFASDFPHEPTIEDIKEGIHEILERRDLDDEDKMNIFNTNPRRLYKF
jgi:predicted TIM-barrel fold metal-dependent hydrolase